MQSPPSATKTSSLELFLAEAPPKGTLTPICETLLWLRIGLPFRLNHINVWLMKEAQGWVIIDTGTGAQETQDLWQQVFRNMLEGEAPTRVISTHFHPDHIGCAGWLVKHYRIPFFAPLTEWSFGRMLSFAPAEIMSETITRYYTRFGLDGQRLDDVITYGNHYARNVYPLPQELHRIKNGDTLLIGDSTWQVMTFGGHTPEHACLYNAEQNILIAGDQVLPFISPNISVSFFEAHGEPLQDYFDSLHILKNLPEDVLVLPCHGLPFRGLHKRIDWLLAHHAERLAFIENLCRIEPRTVCQMMDALFPQALDNHQLMFAIGEAASHANHLVAQGKLKREEHAVWIYNAIS